MSFLLLHAGRGPDISPSALLISTSFSQNWCLSCLSSALCKSALKTKESIKAQNKRNPSNPLKDFFFKTNECINKQFAKEFIKSSGEKNKMWIQKN
jgi:hypothetical protein